MTKPEPYDAEEPLQFECTECAERVEAESRPGECPECGGRLRNLSKPSER